MGNCHRRVRMQCLWKRTETPSPFALTVVSDLVKVESIPDALPNHGVFR